MMTNFNTDPNGTDPSDTRAGDVEEPGRIVGQVFNDIYFEHDPMSPWYGEPRPIANVPIGIYARVDTVPNVNQPYDPNRWRLIKTVTTSADGAYEALLRSLGVTVVRVRDAWAAVATAAARAAGMSTGSRTTGVRSAYTCGCRARRSSAPRLR